MGVNWPVITCVVGARGVVESCSIDSAVWGVSHERPVLGAPRVMVNRLCKPFPCWGIVISERCCGGRAVASTEPRLAALVRLSLLRSRMVFSRSPRTAGLLVRPLPGIEPVAEDTEAAESI